MKRKDNALRSVDRYNYSWTAQEIKETRYIISISRIRVDITRDSTDSERILREYLEGTLI